MTKSFPIYSVAFNPDPTILASGGQEGIQLWDVATGKLLTSLVGHSDVVTDIAFTNDGPTLISGSWDGTVRFWRVK